MKSFDQDFQEQLAAHYMRDNHFIAQAGDLVEPDYFDNETLAALIAVQKDYIAKYGVVCELKTFVQIMQRQIASKRIKIADMNEAKRLLGVVHKHSLKDRQYVIDTIVEFARHKALENSVMTMADALETQDQTKIDKALQAVDEAAGVGANEEDPGMDFVSSADARRQTRQDRKNGKLSNGGITTGCKELDGFLSPHGGWGRKELSILMGPPKAGKTAALMTFSVNAAKKGLNVLYVSCEVSADILGDRMDSNISGVPLRELDRREAEVETGVSKWNATPNLGTLMIKAYPIRTLKVSELRRQLNKYKAQGITFDMVVVDYGDILAPEMRESDKRHELAKIFQDLRALATVYNCAVLTATQTNKEGTRKAARNVTDGTDVAEDYEKVRTADALITINQSPEDKEEGEVILYFSEMRNTESGLRLRFEQDLSCMRFIKGFIGID